MFATDLWKTLFPDNKLSLYPDELPATAHYHQVTERLKPWWDRADIDSKCSVGKPRPALYIDYFADGPMLLNVEIGWKRRKP
jgi:hypothetical protein